MSLDVFGTASSLARLSATVPCPSRGASRLKERLAVSCTPMDDLDDLYHWTCSSASLIAPLVAAGSKLAVFAWQEIWAGGVRSNSIIFGSSYLSGPIAHDFVKKKKQQSCSMHVGFKSISKNGGDQNFMHSDALNLYSISKSMFQQAFCPKKSAAGLCEASCRTFAKSPT